MRAAHNALYYFMKQFILALALLGFARPFHLFAQSPLIEEEAVKLFRSQNPEQKRLLHLIEEAEAERREARLYENPEFSWSREALFSSDSKEDIFSLSAPLSVTGRYELSRLSADFAFAEKKGALEWRIFELENNFRESFYDLFRAQERIRAVTEGLAKLKNLTTALHGRGRSDLYDQLRVNKEASEMETLLEKSRIEEKLKLAVLNRFLGQASSSTFQIVGSLDPQRKIPSLQAVAVFVQKRPDRLGLEAALKKEDSILRLVRRGRIPDIKLTAGMKKTGEPNETGYVAGLSLDLPVFDRGQHRQEQARARQKIVNAEIEAWELEKRLSLETLYSLAQRRRSLLKSYQQTTLRQAEQLERTVGISYLEGRRTLLELIDGYRESLETQLRLLELSHESILADLALERLCGVPLENVHE